MSNMGYCRFQNTLGDLQDCFDNLEEELVSEEEIKARKELISLCKDIVAEADLLDLEDDG